MIVIRLISLRFCDFNTVYGLLEAFQLYGSSGGMANTLKNVDLKMWLFIE